MSETTYALGESLVGGFKLHTAIEWNTSSTGLAIGANDRNFLTEVDLKPAVEYAENDALPGGVAIRFPSVLASINYVGKVKMLANYHGLGRWFAALFGSEATTDYGVTSAAYQHLFTFAVDSPYYGALAYHNRLEAHDFPFVYVNGVTITWATNQIPMVEFDVAAKFELIDGSGLNTISSLDSDATFLTAQPTTRYPMLHAAVGTIRMNTSSGAALGSGDKRYPSGLSISIKRAINTVQTLANAPYIDQPHANGWIDVMATLTFPEYKTAADWTAALAGTKTKLDATFIGDVIGSSETFAWIWELPGLQIDSKGLPGVSKPGVLGYSIPLKAERTFANPSGMAFTLPRFTMRDSISGNHYQNAVS